MKEKNIQRIPNARNIIIPKKTFSFEEISDMMINSFKKLSKPSSKILYCYLITYPEDNIKIGYNSTFEQILQCSKNSRIVAFNELLQEGFLSQLSKEDFLFIANPSWDKINNKIVYATPSMSKGESLIQKILEDNFLSFEKECIYADCIFKDTNCYARFDFEVNNSYIIEFDGEQHFQRVPYWDKAADDFEKRHNHDLQKNHFCFQNNIPLIRIPFYIMDNITIEDLTLKTSKWIITADNENIYFKEGAKHSHG